LRPLKKKALGSRRVGDSEKKESKKVKKNLQREKQKLPLHSQIERGSEIRKEAQKLKTEK
jgi:hypothetical protein